MPHPGLDLGSVMAEDNKARISEFIGGVLTKGEIDASGGYFYADMVIDVP
jgi:hypothetical protein